MNKRPFVLALVVSLAACSPKGQALYDRAEKSLQAGDVRAAVIDLKSLVQSEPTNARARLLLSQAMLQTGDVDGAAIEIDKAKSLGAEGGDLLLAECRLSEAKGEFSAVVQKCVPSSTPGVDENELRIVHAQGLLGLERAPEAMAEFQSVLKSRPDSLDAVVGLAFAQHLSGAVADVSKTFDAAPDSLKKRAAFWLNRGGLEMRALDYPAAEKSFLKAVELVEQEPDSRERLGALGGLAESQIRQGKIDESRATTEKLSKAAPRNPYAKMLRAQVLAAGGDFEEARTLLEEVIAGDPKNFNARVLLGITQLQLGNPGQAEMHFANVVANQPDNMRAQQLLASTRSQLKGPEDTLADLKSSMADGAASPEMLAMAGRLSLASGSREGALKYLEQAQATGAESLAPQAAFEIASGYLAAGEPDKALAVLESVSTEGATELQRRYALAAVHVSRGDKDKAKSEADEILKQSGGSVDGRNAAATIYMAVGQKGLAREQLEEVQKLKPKSPDGLLNLARIDLAEGNLDAAVSKIGQARKLDAGSLQASLLMALIESQRKNPAGVAQWLDTAVKDNPQSVEAHVAAGQYYLSVRNFERARELADAVGKTAPPNAAVFNLRGLALMGSGDNGAAVASFKQAINLSPEYPGLATNLARAQAASGDAAAAQQTLDGVIKSNPTNRAALSMAASNSLQTGRLEAASGYIGKLDQLDPGSPTVLALKADLAMRQKRFSEAAVLYEQALRANPSERLAIVAYAAARMAGNPDAAGQLRTWLAAHPADEGARIALAEDYSGKGDDAAAAREYEAALKQSPKSGVMLNNLAVIYDRMGDKRALETAQLAYEQQKSNPAIQDTYGWLLLRSGDVDRGVDLLRQAAKGMPGSMEVQYHYAAALARKGDKAGALAALELALKGQGSASIKADAEKLQKELRK